MVNNIVSILAGSTPGLRARYLQRIRQVAGPEARQLEAELRSMVERDRAAA